MICKVFFKKFYLVWKKYMVKEKNWVEKIGLKINYIVVINIANLDLYEDIIFTSMRPTMISDVSCINRFDKKLGMYGLNAMSVPI